MKLKSIERCLIVQDDENDEVLAEHILNINLEDLLCIVTPNDDDPFLNGTYELGSEQLNKVLVLSGISRSDLLIDFQKNLYLLHTWGIYEYNR